jgi:peptide/nickel transport system substrate-binding protein
MMINLGYAETPKRGGDLRWVSYQFPKQFNLAIQSGTATMLPGTQLFASLVDFDDKWQPVPYLAKSWEISKDGLTYTFHLVENATFHDGKPVTSEDVEFSFNIVKKNHPFGIAMFAAVDRVETPDRYTAVFKLNNHHPALFLALSPALMPVIPKHVYNEEEHGPIRKNPANTKPIGSGPFKFVEWKPGEYWIFERYENYFRSGLPYLDRIICTKIRDPNATMISLQRGDFHLTTFSGGIRLKDLSRLKKVEHLVITTKGYEAIGPINYLEFNLRKEPFSDIQVRRAIAYAIDRKFINEKLHHGLTEELTGPFHKASPYYTREVKTYDIDLEKANKLLDEAGYPRKSGGMRFSATLDWYPGSYDNQQMLAEYLKSQLRKIGIDIQLRPPVDFGTWIKRISSWKYDLTMNAYFSYGDPVVGVHRIYLCDNIKHQIWTNTEGWCNRKADEILKTAAVETDFEKRKTLYVEFQKIFNEDLPLYTTHKQAHFTIHHNDLRNVVTGIWGPLSPLDKVYWKEGHEPK